MDAAGKQPIVYWTVRYIDRTTRKFFSRILLLDWDALALDEGEALLTILRGKKTDLRVLNFRPFFKEVRDQEFMQLKGCGGFLAVNSRLAGVDYFEDEAGNPLGEIGMMQIASGQEYPVILGNAQSVIRLGPSGVRDKAAWTVDDANDIAHFLDLVGQIRECDWQQRDLRISFQGDKLLEFEQADEESTRSFFALMRQFLLKQDDALNVACAAYYKHVADLVKAAWVEHEQKGFAEARNHVPVPFQLGPYTMEQVIDMMIYGAGLAHRKSRDNWDQTLPSVIAQYGEERFLFVFHASCKTLLNFAFRTARVIEQDFNHWITNEGCAGPNRVLFSKLFD